MRCQIGASITLDDPQSHHCRRRRSRTRTIPQPIDPPLHRQLRWKGSCAVEFADTACRTVRYHESAFGPSLGFEGTMYSECVEAVVHTGSESNMRNSVWRRFWFFPRQTRKITELVLRTENRTVYIDHERKNLRVTRARGK